MTINDNDLEKLTEEKFTTKDRRQRKKMKVSGKKILGLKKIISQKTTKQARG